MVSAPDFDEYLAALGRLTGHLDPTASTPQAQEIRDAARELDSIDVVDAESVARWVQQNPTRVPILGLAVGLSQERLKNVLRDQFGTSGWITLALRSPRDLIDWLDDDFDLLRLLTIQRDRTYEFGDVLIARAGTRVTATRAGQSGRRVEDEIEAIAVDLDLPYRTRTRFSGRNGQTAPCDLVIPDDDQAQIVVAAKGFDSTGSKLTDAVREIQEMASIRRPSQYVMAVIDGIGWKSRIADLRRIHQLWVDGDIDGMYTLSTLDAFRHDLETAARLRGFL
jgi:predicted secreted protein